MKINTNYKVRNVAGENIVLLQGKMGGDMTRVVALSNSALMLWNKLQGVDFSVDDAVNILMEQYEVERLVALADVKKWIQTLWDCGLLVLSSQDESDLQSR